MSERNATQRANETMRRLQHELRTPIGQIMGYSELIEEELEDRGIDDLADDLGKIRSAARRLLDLVDGKLKTTDDPGAPPMSAEPAAATDASASPAGATSGAAAGPDASGETDDDTETRFAGARLLVVDDDARNRDLLARRLARRGFEVDTASDGVDGLRRIDTTEYDLVILDVMMPGMSGFEVLERVRRKHSMSELPVILATALADSADTVEGLQRGANDYVTKPLDFPVVIARIETHLSAHRAAHEVAKLADQLEFRNAFIKQALGREVSDDLLVEMAETPDAIDLGGDSRHVVALVADLRGAQGLASKLAPAEYVAVLNSVLGSLCDIVQHYDGVVDSLSGDSLCAVFGLPVPLDDDSERAVACGIAMQLEMDEVNARNQRARLPEVEIGVGLATGNVVVGAVGHGEQLKLKAIGEPLVAAARIEAAALAREVWICDETRSAVADVLESDAEREIAERSGSEVLRIHRVLGISGTHLISLRSLPPLT
jgi:DNA-binding response OmpR family regulator